MLDKENIGDRFLQVRKHVKIGQVLFSEQLSVSQQTISQIENGKITPSLELLIKITSNYCIDLNWLILGEGDMIKEKKTENKNIIKNNRLVGYNNNVSVNEHHVEYRTGNNKKEYTIEDFSEQTNFELKKENEIMKIEQNALKKENELLREMITILKSK